MKLHTRGVFGGVVAVMATLVLGFGTVVGASALPAADTSASTSVSSAASIFQAASMSIIVSLATANLGHRACDTTTPGEGMKSMPQVGNAVIFNT